MQTFLLENDTLRATIRSKSAELISIIKKETNVEYLWNGDARYWNWTSPILFPVVGMVRDKKYIYRDKSYPMSQHGFARDYEFELVSQTDNEIWFAFASSEETRQIYPFDFRLEIGYRLEAGTIQVLWKVINTDEKVLHFSIGAHPAFMCPLAGEGVQSDYYMGFETTVSELKYKLIDPSCNLIAPQEHTLALADGLHQIEKDRFDLDALVIEDHQTHKMWLAKPDKTPYVSVEFDTPLFGVWSPAKLDAPFICIEPWYGRSDGNYFYGTLEEREYGNTAAPGEVFERSYKINIL